MPVIGFLELTSLPDTQTAQTDRLRAFRLGLKDTGYVEGENVAIEYRWADNHLDRLPELVAELVRRQVAVIAAIGSCGIRGQGGDHDDPHCLHRQPRPGQAWSCRQPCPAERQRDRYQSFGAELAAKRLDLLRELVPGAARVAVLVNPANATTTESTLRDVEAAARAHGAANPGLQCQHQPRNRCGLRHFCARAAGRAFCRPRTLFHRRRVQLVNLASRHAIPTTYAVARRRRNRRADELRNEPDRCVSSGWRLYRPHPQGRQAGRPAGRANDQVRAGHQRPDRPDARPHVPPTLLASADEVIE